ncbi:cyclin-T1-like [Melia azedarach]|uniref:Cyclin-T1-like n=1 Tax=Melia azedarach TaxID=155640 RepID=A0ACC1XNZ7_MELAZ|nr:cyclin-T1-like [Melia azedarach]
MAKFCREKGVLITMYEEKPRRRRVPPNQHQHHHHYLHHHHHHYHYLHNASASAGKEYNRRAELLRYSERLRETARSAPSTPLLQPKPAPPNNQQPATKTIEALRRQSSARTPNCLGNCKILIPCFIRPLTSPQGKRERKKKKQSSSTSNKVKAFIKSFQVQKKRGFIPKLLSTLRKHR